MTELNWLRSKARLIHSDTMVISEDEARDAGCEPGTYRSDLYVFEGHVPPRMMMALKNRKYEGDNVLVSTETEHETLQLGTGQRSGWTYCRYGRSVYTLLDGAKAEHAA